MNLINFPKPFQQSTIQRKEPLPYEVEDIKARLVGVDDLNSAIAALDNYEPSSETEDQQIDNIIDHLEAAIEFSVDGHKILNSPGQNHYMASRSAYQALSVMGDNKNIGSIFISCRDGDKRNIYQVIKWFMKLHINVEQKIIALHSTHNQLKVSSG